jgi:hypothetical protein
MIRTIGRIPAERATSYQIRKVFEHPDAEERLPADPIPIFAPAANHAAANHAAANHAAANQATMPPMGY